MEKQRPNGNAWGGGSPAAPSEPETAPENQCVPEEDADDESAFEMLRAVKIGEINRTLNDENNAGAVDKNGDIRTKIKSLGDKIGEGPHSVVYRGEQVGTGRIVAVKVDKRPLTVDFRDIQKKIKILKHLKHPRIAKLLDFVPDWKNNQSYFIMEYVDGKSLNTALAEEGTIEQSRVLDWACQILDILHYLHTDRRVNGDVRLSNLIWKSSDTHNHNHIYMTDFSYLMKGDYKIGKANRDGETVDSTETIVRTVFGQAQSKEEFQAKVQEDIYRVGCALFQLLTGDDIEKRKDTLEKKKKRLRDDWKRNRLGAEGVFPSVIEIILKATANAPEARYQSAQEMLEALKALPEKDYRYKKSGAMLMGIVAASLALLLAGAGLFAMGEYQQRRQLDMDRYASLSAEARANGDYTLALDYARQAANRRNWFDPPCTETAQSALATALNVYSLGTGYQPLHSAAILRGTPLQVRLSPDGGKTAVLVDNFMKTEGSKGIQIFDTETGDSLVSPLTPDSAAPADCVFLDDDILLYTKSGAMAAFSVSQNAELWFGLPASSLTLSADGLTAASISADNKILCLYDTQKRAYAQIPMRGAETIPVDEGGESRRLFALNQDGTRLAVSFPDGSLRLYTFSDPGVPGDGSNYQEIVAPSAYARFEGGFCGEYFFYCASSVQKDAVSSECALLDENGVSILRRADFDIVHAQADESGICFSIGSRVLLVDLETRNWRTVAKDAGQEVLSVRHIPGRVLVVTSDEIVWVYTGESGGAAQSIAVSRGIPFTIAEMAGDKLVLASVQHGALSVLKWVQGYQEAPSLFYGMDFQRVWASARSDKNGSMLFRVAEGDVFRIYDADGNMTASRALNDWRDILSIKYQRAPFSPEEPDGDCLRVEYADRVDFYSAEDGKPLNSLRRESSVSYQRGHFLTKHYRVENLNGGKAEIYDAVSGKRRSALDAYQIQDVSEGGGYLLLSMLDPQNQPCSVALNKKLEVVAEIPGACQLLPDGALYFDDQLGHLVQGKIYTVKELQTN